MPGEPSCSRSTDDVRASEKERQRTPLHNDHPHMYRELDECGPPISKDDLTSLERQLGCTLPLDYAEFLLRTNGGSPTPDTVPIQNWPEGGPDDDVRMLYFYGADPSHTCDLRWRFAVYAGRMPEGLLPIATTGGGDQFCMWLTGTSRGAVVLWDHEAEDQPPTHANLHPVAPNFTAFLALLMDPPED